MVSLFINYKSSISELCEIGKKYDTDKSSQRLNVSSTNHCHPYTLFYDSLFNSKKNEKLEIAELGILCGASLLMWREYFTHSNIYGFEVYTTLIENFKSNFNNERITLSEIDIKNKESIQNSFRNLNKQFDIIIEDTTHLMEDQIRIIENVYDYLKPGGILIIEDIFKIYNENDYLDRLEPFLQIYFQDFYFVTLDHTNRNSDGWDNDKLFVLVKKGAEPIFQNQNKVTIITPSIRTNNLIKLRDSINFNYVDEWIIVYDETKIPENPNLFEKENNEKIKEYLYKGEGSSGNPQRNYALTKIKNKDTFIYYLDDDNLIHQNFYKLLNIANKNYIYTFNQKYRLKGDRINFRDIDTAMYLIHYSLCTNITWDLYAYHADFLYIKECYERNKEKFIYIDNDLSFYNRLNYN